VWAAKFYLKTFMGAKMNSVAKTSAQVIPAATNNLIVNAMAVICGLGLVVFACMVTNGLDMSVGFF
jgi:hypothetical protein